MEAEAIASRVRRDGCAHVPSEAGLRIDDLLPLLGRLLPNHDGQYHCDLRPHTQETAPRASMSSFTGAGPQPPHTDAAFMARPPRYLVFECLHPGEHSCPTNVWSLDVSRLVHDGPDVLTAPGWLVSGGGKRPFYCQVLTAQGAEPWVRFDPCCMRPPSSSGRGALDEAAKILAEYSTLRSFSWDRSALLIIDNWRCLHGRAGGGESAPSRRLRRWSIEAADGLGF